MAIGSRLVSVTNAAIDALKADSTLTTLLGGTAKVYAYVPEDTSAPFVLVSGGGEDAWAEAFNGDDGRATVVKVQGWSTYRGTKQVDEIIDRCLLVLLADAAWSGIAGYAGREYAGSAEPLPPQQVGGVVWYERTVRVRVLCG